MSLNRACRITAKPTGNMKVKQFGLQARENIVALSHVALRARLIAKVYKRRIAASSRDFRLFILHTKLDQVASPVGVTGLIVGENHEAIIWQ